MWCTCTHSHTHTHTCAHTHKCARTHTHTHTHKDTYLPGLFKLVTIYFCIMIWGAENRKQGPGWRLTLTQQKQEENKQFALYMCICVHQMYVAKYICISGSIDFQNFSVSWPLSFDTFFYFWTELWCINNLAVQACIIIIQCPHPK